METPPRDSKRFAAPKRLSPFYRENIKIPRKMKKKAKAYCGPLFRLLTNGQRLWLFMEKSNFEYKRFLIMQICKNSKLQ